MQAELAEASAAQELAQIRAKEALAKSKLAAVSGGDSVGVLTRSRAAKGTVGAISVRLNGVRTRSSRARRISSFGILGALDSMTGGVSWPSF